MASYRTLEEYQQSVTQAGARVYHHLSESQKTELKALLLEALSAPPDEHSEDLTDSHSAVSWRQYVEQVTEKTIRDRNAQGEPVDAQSVTDSVLPMAHAAIPLSVRQKLFARIFDLIHPKT